MTRERRRGMLVVLSGPSGCGKTTIARRLVADGVCEKSISATTRHPRRGERDRADYYFLSKQEFMEWARRGDFAEYAEYCGHLYGSPREPLEKALDEGRTLLLVIEVKGAEQIKKKYPDAVLIFVSAPSGKEVVKRLSGRKTETDVEIALRKDRAVFEESRASRYDYRVVNAELDAAVAEIKDIIERERLSRQRA